MNMFGGMFPLILAPLKLQQFGGVSISAADWNFFNQQVKLGGFSTVAGRLTPNDPTPGPQGDNRVATMTYSNSSSSDVPSGSPVGTTSIRLVSSGSVDVGYGTVHGPYMVSKSTAYIPAGKTIEFWWKAEGGSDAFDVYAYVVDASTGYTLEILNQTGASDTATTPWTKASKVVPTGRAGSYYFVFISGSYDFTGGKALGASLYVARVAVV